MWYYLHGICVDKCSSGWNIALKAPVVIKAGTHVKGLDAMIFLRSPLVRLFMEDFSCAWWSQWMRVEVVHSINVGIG